jgi:hypothetical protein
LRIPFGRSYWVRPGLLLAGSYPGDKDKNIAAQKLQALVASGIRHIINFMEAGETNEYGQPFVPYEKDFIDSAKGKGIGVLVSRMPIKDVSIPTPNKKGVRSCNNTYNEKRIFMGEMGHPIIPLSREK